MTTSDGPPAEDFRSWLGRIESLLETLVREKAVKEWYSTAEVAALVGRAEYTVREWCRQGRVRAVKKAYARGAHPEWLIAHDELNRFRNEGLRPVGGDRSQDTTTAVSRTPGR